MEYPWYELQKNSSDITQGDIIKGCFVPILKDINITEGCDVKAEISEIDGIVMTQACDIANNKAKNIILCAITSRNDFIKSMESCGKSKDQIKNNIKGIIKGQQHSYHILNNYISDEFTQDFFIVNFSETYSVPIDVARAFAQRNANRLRLCPPYREHLSQAFARYFMRVGLPINIDIDL